MKVHIYRLRAIAIDSYVRLEDTNGDFSSFNRTLLIRDLQVALVDELAP